MAAENGYVRMRANTEHDVIAACGQQLKRLKGFRNPRAPLMLTTSRDGQYQKFHFMIYH